MPRAQEGEREDGAGVIPEVLTRDRFSKLRIQQNTPFSHRFKRS